MFFLSQFCTHSFLPSSNAPPPAVTRLAGLALKSSRPGSASPGAGSTLRPSPGRPPAPPSAANYKSRRPSRAFSRLSRVLHGCHLRVGQGCLSLVFPPCQSPGSIEGRAGGGDPDPERLKGGSGGRRHCRGGEEQSQSEPRPQVTPPPRSRRECPCPGTQCLARVEVSSG